LRSMSLGDALVVSPAGSGKINQGDRTRVILLSDQASSSPPI